MSRCEEFDEDHSDIDYRMDTSLPFLYRALKLFDFLFCIPSRPFAAFAWKAFMPTIGQLIFTKS